MPKTIYVRRGGAVQEVFADNLSENDEYICEADTSKLDDKLNKSRKKNEVSMTIKADIDLKNEWARQAEGLGMTLNQYIVHKTSLPALADQALLQRIAIAIERNNDLMTFFIRGFNANTM